MFLQPYGILLSCSVCAVRSPPPRGRFSTHLGFFSWCCLWVVEASECWCGGDVPPPRSGRSFSVSSRRFLVLGISPLATPCWWLLGLGGSSQADHPWPSLGLGSSSWLARQWRLLLAGHFHASDRPLLGAACLPPPGLARIACSPPVIGLCRLSAVWVLMCALVSALVVMRAWCGIVQVRPVSA